MHLGRNVTSVKISSRKVTTVLTHLIVLVLKSGVVDNVLNYAKFKAEQAMAKTSGSKRSRLTGYMKLDDASKAGTREGHRCTLILTEGDSAKALTTSGLGIVGREYFGGLSPQNASHRSIPFTRETSQCTRCDTRYDHEKR